MAVGGIGGRTSSTSVENDSKNYVDVPGDVEKQPRKMSRIGKSDVLDDSDSSVSVGAQIELEKENAIQYRTCSWQKVSMTEELGTVSPTPAIPAFQGNQNSHEPNVER